MYPIYRHDHLEPTRAFVIGCEHNLYFAWLLCSMAISVNSIAQDDSSPFALYTLRGKAVAKTKLFPRVSQRLKSTVTRHILNNERHPRFSKSGYFNKRSNRNAENRHQTRVSATLCNNYTVCSPSLIVSAKNNTYRTVMMQGKFVLFITGLAHSFLTSRELWKDVRRMISSVRLRSPLVLPMKKWRLNNISERKRLVREIGQRETWFSLTKGLRL